MNEDKDCLDSENNSKYCFFKVANAFLLLANMLLIILGFHYLPTCLSEDSSYFSVIVAVLGILITVLITWQIWTTITSREEVRKIDTTLKRLGKLESNLNNQRNLFKKHNLEIKNLIDAHAKILEAEKIEDLPNKYNAYIEAFDLLLQSNVGATYEQFDKIILGLEDVTSKFPNVDNADDAWHIITSEQEFEWGYRQLMAKLEQRSDEIEALRRKLTTIKEFREEGLRKLKSTDIGKRALQINAEIKEQRKRLEAEEAARKASEAKGDTTP